MSDEDVDERLVANLLAYDEALAQTGDFVQARERSGVIPAELASELERAQECIDLLNMVWPATSSQPVESPPGEAGARKPPLLASTPPWKELGRFQLLEVLGQGGVGTVYKALHTRLDRIVAVKVLNPVWVADPESLARFRREMKTIGKLAHPHLVAALDADEWQGVHYLVMEYVKGLDLQTIVRRGGPLGVANACEVARQTASALSYIHREGFVHRDVKPANLMLGDDGHIRLLDMGLALLKEPGPADFLTRKGHMVGTADFMAPEQMLDTHAVNDPTDLYSLGCTLFYLLCGRPPFGSDLLDTPGKKALAHATLPVPPLMQLRPEIPAGLAALITGLMAKDPAQRPVSARVVGNLLEPFCRQANLAALIQAMTTPSDPGAGKPPPHPPITREAGDRQESLDTPLFGQIIFFLLVATTVFVLVMVSFPGDCRQAQRPSRPTEEVLPDRPAPPIDSAAESGGSARSETPSQPPKKTLPEP